MTLRQRQFIAKMDRAETQWQKDVNARIQSERVGANRERITFIRSHIDRQTWPVFGIDRQRWVAQNGRCFWCCCDLYVSGFHTDHVMPRSKGGTNHPSNLRLACPQCNLAKKASLPMDFALSLLRY